MISSAGVWQAPDLLATLQDKTLRGTALADAELRYVAPELMTGRSADVRSDVFTMGVLAYEMATGVAAVRRRLDARALGEHVARRARESVSQAIDAASAGSGGIAEGPASNADRSLRHRAGVRRRPVSGVSHGADNSAA